MIRKIIKNFNIIIKNNIFVLGIVWRLSKLRFLIKIIVTVISSILPTINIIIVRYIISLLESDIPRTDTMLRQLFIVIIGLTSMQLIPKLFLAFNSALIEPFLASKINNYMNEMFFDKAQLFEYKNFEDPNFYDKYTRALAQTENIPHMVFNSFFQLFGSIISILSLSALIISMDWVVIMFTMFVVLVNFIQSIISGKLDFNMAQVLTPISRRQNYLKRVLYNSAYAKEIQCNDVIGTGKRYYFEAFEKLLKILKRYGIKSVGLNVVSILLTTASSTTMMLYLFSRVWLGVYSIADYSALMSSSGQFEGTLKAFFESLSNFYRNSLEIDNLKFIYFYKRESTDGHLTLNAERPYTLEVKNLYFKYPNSDKYALKNISFKINAGEKVLLVGLNGSGKTTLIKILLGLYQPQRGEILINGINLKEYKREEILKKMGVVFQDYQTFAFTIKENISFEEEMNTRVYDILEELDLTPVIKALPNGMHTSLSKEFDTIGTLLSGGEAQKICIARALNKETGLYIFDEPSSALDPISEYKLNKLLDKITNKTVIIISHRLTTAITADNILFLKSGELVEQGTHKELMKRKGYYFDLFTKQAEKYGTEYLISSF